MRFTAVNYTEYHQLPSGEVALIGRVKYAAHRRTVVFYAADTSLGTQEPPRRRTATLSRALQEVLPEWPAGAWFGVLSRACTYVRVFVRIEYGM